MKLLLFISFFISGSLSADTLWPNKAYEFLKEMKCEFSAFAIYKGPSGGPLVNGQAKSIAFCASSYEEKGALKKKFCWLRGVDMKTATYTDRDGAGSAWREDNSYCSKEVISKILNKGSVKSIISLKSFNCEWKIVDDKTGNGQEYLKLFPHKNN